MCRLHASRTSLDAFIGADGSRCELPMLFAWGATLHNHPAFRRICDDGISQQRLRSGSAHTPASPQDAKRSRSPAGQVRRVFGVIVDDDVGVALLSELDGEVRQLERRWLAQGFPVDSIDRS